MKKLFIICLLISSNLILSETERVNLAFKDINRHYLVYEPSSNINDPKKIVIGLHGYTGSASGFEIETTGGFNAMAESIILLLFIRRDYIFMKKITSGEQSSQTMFLLGMI